MLLPLYDGTTDVVVMAVVIVTFAAVDVGICSSLVKDVASSVVDECVGVKLSELWH